VKVGFDQQIAIAKESGVTEIHGHGQTNQPNQQPHEPNAPTPQGKSLQVNENDQAAEDHASDAVQEGADQMSNHEKLRGKSHQVNEHSLENKGNGR
jgi:hypothetical protein